MFYLFNPIFLLVGVGHRAYRKLLWATLRTPETSGTERHGSMTIIEG
jgi:hypothetical protein